MGSGLSNYKLKEVCTPIKKNFWELGGLDKQIFASWNFEHQKIQMFQEVVDQSLIRVSIGRSKYLILECQECKFILQ